MDKDILQLANKFEKNLQWANAAIQYVQLLERTPTPRTYERAAWCFSRAGNYNEAIKYLLILVEIEPKLAKWPYMIGYQYYCLKQWPIAIEWFEKALELYPDYFIVKYRLAYACIQNAGTYKQLTKAVYWKALGHLRDCHSLWNTFNKNKKQREQDTYFNVNFLHGKALMNLPRQYMKAIQLFKVALNIKPNDKFAKYNLAKTYYLNGDYQKAKNNIPSGNEYYFLELKAFIEAKLGNYQEAISIIKQLLYKRKKDYLYASLAEIYLMDGKLDDAYKNAHQATLVGNNNHKNYYILAKIYYQYGLLNKATENLNSAIKIKKDKYGGNYEKCVKLKDKIESEKTVNYCDDKQLIIRLEKENLTSKSQFVQSVISHYNSNRGFGFIKGEPKNVFFHISNCKYDNVQIGDRVQFTILTTKQGPAANDIRKI